MSVVAARIDDERSRSAAFARPARSCAAAGAPIAARRTAIAQNPGRLIIAEVVIALGGLASVTIIVFAGWAALNPQPMAWAYIVLVAAFELWLVRRIRAVGFSAVTPLEPPYHFSAEEAELVGRYRFYFAYPTIARDSSSVLAAIGLTALLLTPWLTYKLAFFQAMLIGANLFMVARFTKLLAPQMALRVAAARGDRQALRLLEVHDPAWEKIRAGNRPQ